MGKHHDSCNDNEVGGIQSGNCVCDVVRTIADAQDDVADRTCDVSCVRSIRSLVSPVTTNGLDTVPFILYGKDHKPFKGFGAEFKSHGNGPAKFDCVESFIFRVKEVGDDCCAVLELLVFDNEHDACHDPCEQINKEEVADLERTGICITVDLNCFCAITCLPAVSLF
ncbi:MULTISPECIES: CotY/CotZ family spore coat protein [Gracilibacillus]|uniref:Spore coat protein n=1 Tax=Gracilibacillus dipsosauri TaxID=178340 RepID=A0A317KWA3_9BACI|nr:CotY/CotZ family spore coat protein [Gracilibacillus dipsosauri]PWU67695.1 spore coat protein [Gracilibacillus dipsosauri]